MEFTSSLVRSFPPKSLDHVSLRDIIYFLIWKDKDSKTEVIHIKRVPQKPCFPAVAHVVWPSRQLTRILVNYKLFYVIIWKPREPQLPIL